jgi:hypothetical protein
MSYKVYFIINACASFCDLDFTPSLAIFLACVWGMPVSLATSGECAAASNNLCCELE